MYITRQTKPRANLFIAGTTLREKDKSVRGGSDNVNCCALTLDSFFKLRRDEDIFSAPFTIRLNFLARLPVWRLSRAVGELPSNQPLVAAQCELGPYQEASIEVGEAAHLEQRGHRWQGCFLLIFAQL